MAFISAAQIRAEHRAMKLRQEAEALFAAQGEGERSGASATEAPACAGARDDAPSECRALVVVRPWVGAGFAQSKSVRPELVEGQSCSSGAAQEGSAGLRQAQPEREPSEVLEDSDRRTIFLPELKSRFLEHLSEYGNVALACKRAGVSRQTAYRERRRQPAFAKLWDAAMLAARTVAEEALAERAVHGVEEPLFYHGEEIGHRRRYSDRLLLAHLARLDKVEAKPEVEVALAGLDDAIEALGRGEELREEIPETKPVHPEPDEGQERDANGLRQAQPERDYGAYGPEENDALDSVPYVPLPPDYEFDPIPPCDNCGGPCDEPFADLTPEHCMWPGNRLKRMEAARPRGVPKPHELANSVEDADEIERLQIDAFECEMPEWWTITSEEQLEAAFAALD